MITKSDLSARLLKNIEPLYIDIIIDFCNSFLSLYGHILSKEKLIERINLLDGIYKTKTECDDVEIAKHIFQRKPFKTHIYINDNIKFSFEELKISIYHELIHHISIQHYIDELNRDRYYEGLQPIGLMFDEVLTEAIAINLINLEGINLNKNKISKESSLLDVSQEYLTSGGTGYSTVSALGKIYLDIFDNEILNAKFNNLGLFFQNINPWLSSSINKNFYTISSEIEIAWDNNTKKDVYNCYLTAVDVFEAHEREKFNNSEFNLYEYLSDTAKLIKQMPKIAAGNQIQSQINNNIIEILKKRIRQLDNEFIKKYFEKSNTNFSNILDLENLNTVINVLRDNIEILNENDFNNIVYGKMLQYNHSNSDCLVITAGNHKFLTFSVHSNIIDEDVDHYEYGSKVFKELSQEDKVSVFGENSKFDNVSYSTIYTTRGAYTILSVEQGLIPLTNNKDLRAFDLSEVVIINGSDLMMEERKKTN